MNQIEQFTQDIRKSFELWKEIEIDTRSSFKILMQFYKPDRSSSSQIVEELSKLDYTSTVKLKRSLFIFKGTELVAIKENKWTEENLLEELIKLNEISEKYSFQFERFMAETNY